MQIITYLVPVFAILVIRTSSTTECIAGTDPLGANYRGTVSRTENGVACQRWNTNWPHKPAGDQIPDDVSSNYCRNPKPDPDDSNRPWCYTTHPDIRWEYCDMEFCDEYCLREAILGVNYKGTVSQTENGVACQRWDAIYPHEPADDQLPDDASNNYCRNPKPDPEDSIRPWCYTTDSRVRWEYCDVGYCPEYCVREALLAVNYRGTVSLTENGLTCQRWDANSPHKPAEDQLPGDVSNNYCRNPTPDPDNSIRPWCYTTHPDIRWEYCDIAHCPEYCFRKTILGVNYIGTVSQTQSGIQCQRWDANSPHVPAEDQLTGDISHNYCRNPKPDPDDSIRPWCYTTHRDKRWEYCNIQFCD